MTMSDKSFNNMKEILDRSTVYHYIGRKDAQIISIFHWMKILENLADEMAESEMNSELEIRIREIITKLTVETGHRMCMILSDVIGDEEAPKKLPSPEMVDSPSLLRRMQQRNENRNAR